MTTDKPIRHPFTDDPIMPPTLADSREFRFGMVQALRRVFVYGNPPATQYNARMLIEELGISEDEYRGWNQEVKP